MDFRVGLPNDVQDPWSAGRTGGHLQHSNRGRWGCGVWGKWTSGPGGLASPMVQQPVAIANVAKGKRTSGRMDG